MDPGFQCVLTYLVFRTFGLPGPGRRRAGRGCGVDLGVSRGKHRRCLYRLVVRRSADASGSDPTGLAGRVAGAAPVFHRALVRYVLWAGGRAVRAGPPPDGVRDAAGRGAVRAWTHDRAHYFFARAAWQLDELGLAVARVAVLLLVAPGAAITVAVDDPVFRRYGCRVFISSLS
jgi:hypothetical protein